VTALLIELCKLGFLPNEKRQEPAPLYRVCLGRCPGRRCEQREGWNVVFLLAKMSQDPVEGLPRFIGHDVLILNASDDFDGSTAASANFDKVN
jgi:hypothetical protein